MPLRFLPQRQSYFYMKHLIKKKWVEPALLLFLSICAYGLFIPQLGLFGDDWPHLWVFHMFGMEGLNQLVAWDRPYSAWVYGLIAPLAGDNIWGYHIYLLILRWICTVILFFLVEKLIPESKPLPFWTAALFLLYPGFRQQPQPLEFILHFTALAFFLGSLWFMIKAAEMASRYWLFHFIGVLLALSIFSVEYFIGLELLRPVFLWLVLKKNKGRKNAVLVFKHWLPYLTVLGIYAWWRLFIFKFPTYKPTFLNQSGMDIGNTLFGLGQVLVEEIRAVILGAWRQILSLPIDVGISAKYVLLVAVVFVIIFIILNCREGRAEKTSPYISLLVGSMAVVLAGIPFWITGIPVQLDFPWDRSTLPFMVGGSFLVVGGLLLLRPAIRIPAIALVIALSVGMHFQNYVMYQTEWEKLGQFFWQLAWRAPGLKPGTIVVSDEIPILYYGDNNLTPILNWMYAPDQKSREIAYNFFDMGERLGKNLPELKPNLTVSHGYRLVTFNSDSNSLFPVYYDPENCLKIVDESLKNHKNIPDRLKIAVEFSRPQSLIQTENQAGLPKFMDEPEHGWCYYYQKAGLATQMEDWALLDDVYENVIDLNLSPNDNTEWLPFIEGFLISGHVEIAVELSQIGFQSDEARPVICDLWKNQVAEQNANSEVNDAYKKLGCK